MASGMVMGMAIDVWRGPEQASRKTCGGEREHPPWALCRRIENQELQTIVTLLVPMTKFEEILWFLCRWCSEPVKRKSLVLFFKWERVVLNVPYLLNCLKMMSRM